MPFRRTGNQPAMNYRACFFLNHELAFTHNLNENWMAAGSSPTPSGKDGTVQTTTRPQRKNGGRATLKDIAEATGWSVNTISAVLNERRTKARVSEKTRQTIQEVARSLGYRRNTAASLLAGGRTRTLGVLLDTLANNFGAPLAEAFESEAAAKGYQCFLGCTRFDGFRKLDYIERFLSHNVEGLLLIGVWLDPEVEVALNSVLSTNTPLVTVDLPWADHDVPLICGNHYMGGKILARHLLKTGHRDILYLCPPDTLHLSSIRERIRGMSSAVEEQACPETVFRIIETPGKSLEDVEVALNPHLLRENWPSVIAAGHDLHAFRVIEVLKTRGLRVPEDIAVVGYDDIQHELLWSLGVESSQVLPIPIPITTVRQPVREMGREAARLLIDRIEKGQQSGGYQVMIDVELVVRSSCSLPEWAHSPAQCLTG
ncbi:MAG: HTH-type transcriptional regulator DegA [Candidatus Hinthialibacteria bacterium OLB16]|nr:MAG: HTH-type transcriptional regulator DegA [Candidatus Hinthialibacteria bacterium OLB16]